MGSFFSSPAPEPAPEPEQIQRPPPGQTMVPLVICYGYIGTGYHGLQQNPGERTVEKDLFHALIGAGLMHPAAVKNLARVKWNEASRTDTGVHACAQVLTFFADFCPGMKVKKVAATINAHLPKDSTIRVWAAITVGRVFQAQRFAEYRTYHYLLPLSALGTQDLEWIRTNVLTKFIGAHNFHNYTKRVSATNPSAIRKIEQFHVSEPFDVEGRPFVLFTIRGNSFMMNQIRKMLAVVLAVSYRQIPPERIAETFSEEKWAIAKLPGEGLMLERVEYPGFRKKAQRNEKFANPNKDVEFDFIRGDIQQWKVDVLFPHIANLIAREQTFENWIRDVMTPYPPMTAADMLKLREEQGVKDM